MTVRNNFAGGFHLIIASLFYAAIPLVVSLSGESGNNPFVFMAAWGLGGSISCFAYARTFHGEIHIWSDLKSLLSNKSDGGFPGWGWSVWLALPSSLSLAFYAWSTDFLPNIVTATLIEMWPIFYVVFLQFLFRREKLFKISAPRLSMFLIAFSGAVLVVMSINHEGGVSDLIFNWHFVSGISFLIVAILFSAQTAVFIRWAENAQEWDMSNRKPDVIVAKSFLEARTGYLMIVRSASQAIAGMVGFVLAGFSLGTVSVAEFFLLVISAAVIDVGGTGFNAAGTFRSSNNPGVHSLRFFTPVASAILLLLAGRSGDVMGVLFISGLIILVVSNIAINAHNRNIKEH